MITSIIDKVWGVLPSKLGTIKLRTVHGIVWRYDLVDARTGMIVKRADDEDRLRKWAADNGWTVSETSNTRI